MRYLALLFVLLVGNVGYSQHKLVVSLDWEEPLLKLELDSDGVPGEPSDSLARQDQAGSPASSSRLEAVRKEIAKYKSTRGVLWSYNNHNHTYAQLKEHIMATHGYTPPKELTDEELKWVHSIFHEQERGSYTPTFANAEKGVVRPKTKAPVPTRRYQQYCPNGQCPNVRWYQRR